MKHIFWALLMLRAGVGISQENANAVFQLNSIPAKGVLLDKEWKFYSGDNPEYAKTDYDDSNWQAHNPTQGLHKQPNYAKSGICWLRLKLSISSNLQKEQFALIIRQYIASEIYLNGRLLYRFGTISSIPGETVAYNPETLPCALPANLIGDQVLAVRYNVQSNLNLRSDENFPLPLLEITVLTTNDAFKLLKINERHLPVTNTFRVGAYFILGVLYLAFFLYNPSYKAYLLFFLFSIFSIPSDILQFNYPAEIQKALILSRLFGVLWEIAQLFLLTAVYLLLNFKRGWIYWSLLILSVIGMFIDSWTFSELIVVNLINLELVRSCFKTLKRKTRGSWILTDGAVSFLLLMGAFYIGFYFNSGYWSIALGDSYTIADILYGTAQLSIPIATTIYVALDFGFTNHALQQKLLEVEELSKKTISQEKEKQQILSSVNETLEKQVTERTAELKQSLEHLKSTQAQLIQSEKMASLGELTAGIAHEIQNPLNFVNNFSETNAELIVELKEELNKGAIQEAESIALDIEENEQKIVHHGRRADSIVKNMLEHSRASKGEKQLVDLNALTDEYLRLAYHGFRAKDKSFNATIHTHFDESIGKINIIPQDIGRVLLNLFNNAFYAVAEKKKRAGEEYDPIVTVTTKKENDDVLILVKDNGAGIPQKVKDKIFQPFFTTKPTGEGTGLGLSLSYDIVKAHGGELKVEGREGEGATFVITLLKPDIEGI